MRHDEIKNFEDICELVGGSQPAKDDFIYEPKDGYIRLIQVRDYRTDKFITYIPKHKARRFCNKDDIMIGRYGPPIFGIFKGLEGAYNVALMKAVVNEEICNKDYFYWFLNTDNLRQFVEHSSKRAAGQDGVRKELLDKYPVFVPPLPEQQRIVSILDEAFEAIAKAKANAEQNLRNAKELFESYLQGVFEKKGDGWEEKKLGEIYDVRDGTHDSPKYHNQGFPLITSKNLKNHKLVFDDIKFISELDYININKRSKVNVGDVLFAMIGTIGNPVVVEDKPDYAIKNVALFKVGNNQNSYFLKYFLDSKQTKDIMMKDANGTTQKFVGLGYLRSFKIFVPSIKEQESIVNKLDALRAETKKLEAIYQQKINDLEELKKSMLQKAFSGELKKEKVIEI